MKKSLILLFSSLIILIAASACNKSKDLEKEEQASIDAYMERYSSLNFERKPSGLYYHEVVAGTGRIPVKSDTVSIKYTGKLLDGRIFDSNVGSPNALVVIVGAHEVIKGFEEGITYMAQGGKSILLIPSFLAYGSIGVPYAGIYGYTPMLFEIELVKVLAGPGI